MNRLRNQALIILSKESQMDIVQETSFENLMNIVNSLYNWEPLKIISGLGASGVVSGDSFKISRSGANEITIQPGIATCDEESFISLVEAYKYDTSTLANGLYGVYVRYLEENSVTGNELWFPNGSIEGVTLSSIASDRAEIVLSTTTVESAILLGYVLKKGGVIPSDPSYPHLEVNMEYTEQPNPLEISTFVFGTTAPWYADMGSSYQYVMVGSEYMKLVVTGSDPEVISITARGAFGTIPARHFINDNVILTPILDMRQLSLLRAKDDISITDKTLKYGMLLINGEYRNVVSKKMMAAQEPPALYIPQNAITWLNRTNAMGIISNRVVNAFYGMQSSKINIDNNLQQISDIRYRMLDSDQGSEDYVLLSAELSRVQREIVKNNVQYQELLLKMSQDEINAFMKFNPNKFILIVKATPVEDSTHNNIIVYEARITRTPISSVQDAYKLVNTEIYYTRRRYPVSYNKYNDPVYSKLDESNLTFMIPIEIGERVIVECRTVDEHNMASEWSEQVVYEFSQFSDHDYIQYQQIYSAVVPDLIKNAVITNEYASYIKDMYNDLKNMDAKLQQSQKEFSAFYEDFKVLEGIVLDMKNDDIPKFKEQVNARVDTISNQSK